LSFAIRRASGEAKTRAPSAAAGAAGAGVAAARGSRRGGGGFGGGAAAAASRRAADIVGAFALFQKNGDGGVDLHALGAFFYKDLADHALVHGLEFHRGLVGLDLGEDVARVHGVAFLDQPFGERAVLHGGAERGHQDLGGHGRGSPFVSRVRSRVRA
jgi:hypothetical protein